MPVDDQELVDANEVPRAVASHTAGPSSTRARSKDQRSTARLKQGGQILLKLGERATRRPSDADRRELRHSFYLITPTPKVSDHPAEAVAKGSIELGKVGVAPFQFSGHWSTSRCCGSSTREMESVSGFSPVSQLRENERHRVKAVMTTAEWRVPLAKRGDRYVPVTSWESPTFQ